MCRKIQKIKGLDRSMRGYKYWEKWNQRNVVRNERKKNLREE